MFSRRRLILRSLLHHARAYGTLFLACATTCAIITGALLVGSSIRTSLTDRALERLCGVEVGVVGGDFFREALAREVAIYGASQAGFRSPVPVILLQGTVVHAESGRRASAVNVVGVDSRFASLVRGSFSWCPKERDSVLHKSLATELGGGVGDDVLVYFEKADDVPREHALGRKDQSTERLRLTVSQVLDDSGVSLFDLRNQQQSPKNIFVPLETLARALEQPGRVNSLLLLGAARATTEEKASRAQAAQEVLDARWTLDDIGLRWTTDEKHGHVSLESRAFLLLPDLVEAAKATAAKEKVSYLPVLTNLATGISIGEKTIPYSVVTGVGEWISPTGNSPVFAGVDLGKKLVLNSWAAEDLGAKAGDQVRVDYYDVDPKHDLKDASHTWPLLTSVPLSGLADDPGWTPTYPGISDARRFSDWDPPFPVDYDRVRTKDDDYWKKYKTTPKAFVGLAEAQRLWKSRFGELTAIRFRPSDGESLDALRARLEADLHQRLTAAGQGLVLRRFEEQALRSTKSPTDFGVLFLSMSFFLIVSALLLAATMFRLALETRCRELGLLLAVGQTTKRLSGLLQREGAVVGVLGAVAGAVGGVGYAAAILWALTSWWSGAVNAPFLRLHISNAPVAIGFIATVVLVYLTIRSVSRRLCRVAPRQLLAGRSGDDSYSTPQRKRGRKSLIVGVVSLVVGVSAALAALVGALSPVAGFFLQGGTLFVAGLAFFSTWLSRTRRGGSTPLTAKRSQERLMLLGIRNGRRAPGRSLLTTGLIASATFLVVTVAASRHDATRVEPRKSEGNGGFALFARSSVPLYRSFSTAKGREELNMPSDLDVVFDRASPTLFDLRVRPGDDTSCLNLYAPQEPRLLGVPEAFRERGGFAWASSLAETAAEKENPWLLLEKSYGDDVVPVIGDQATVMWVLHKALGDEIEITSDEGHQVRLKIVGLLSKSLFQGELVASSESLQSEFSISGWSAFLIEAPAESVESLLSAIESGLSDYGVDAQTTGEILREFEKVQNTYLSTFMVLGGLGLLLGTLGLGAVLLRSVLERRGELALLRALGYSREAIHIMVLSESCWLLTVGVVLGAVTAILAVAPSLWTQSADVSWIGLGVTLLLVLFGGVLSASAGLRAAWRIPLLPALRRE